MSSFTSAMGQSKIRFQKDHARTGPAFLAPIDGNVAMEKQK
jgi:hypothetical protein